MQKLALNILVIFTFNSNLRDIISSAHKTSLSARQLGQSIAECFGENQLNSCLENKVLAALDQAIANNDTWKITDFLVVEKNTNKDNHILGQNVTKTWAQQGPLHDKLASRILKLAETRSLRIQLPALSVNRLLSKPGFYSALEDLSVHVEDFAASDEEVEQEEGRKKKHKDKHVALMGGMAMLAVVAQMFLGKVIFIAGAAFVMAKVALLISAMGSLKKGTSGSPAGTEHVIVTGGGGVSSAHSHEHISSWHRRIPFDQKIYETLPYPEQKFTDSTNTDANNLQKHRPRKNYPNKNSLNHINNEWK